MAHQAGFEPTTPAFGGQYSIQLSYWCVVGAIIRISSAVVHGASAAALRAGRACRGDSAGHQAELSRVNVSEHDIADSGARALGFVRDQTFVIRQEPRGKSSF